MQRPPLPQELVQRCGVNPKYEEAGREQGGAGRVHVKVQLCGACARATNLPASCVSLLRRSAGGAQAPPTPALRAVLCMQVSAQGVVLGESVMQATNFRWACQRRRPRCIPGPAHGWHLLRMEGGEMAGGAGGVVAPARGRAECWGPSRSLPTRVPRGSLWRRAACRLAAEAAVKGWADRSAKVLEAKAAAAAAAAAVAAEAAPAAEGTPARDAPHS